MYRTRSGGGTKPVHSRCRDPQLPIGLHRRPPVRCKLSLDGLLVLPYKSAQEHENDGGEHRCLDKLVNAHLCEICRRQRVRRRRNGAIKEQVVEMIPWGLQHEAKDAEAQDSSKLDTLALNCLRCAIGSRNENARSQRFCEQRLSGKRLAVIIPRTSTDFEHAQFHAWHERRL